MRKQLVRLTSGLLNARQRKWLRYQLVLGLELLGIPQFPAHNQLDRKLLRYLGGREGGVFVEAGANDGLSQSNTWHLEKHLGWRGLLIEPIPWAAEICRRRRRAIVESCALGSFEQSGTAITLYYGALMTVAADVSVEHVVERDARRHAAIGASWVGEPATSFQSAVHALSELLDIYNLPRVDLLSLDVEGYELNVLSGIDFNRHMIEYILVETETLHVVQSALASRYDLVDRLSPHDYLFRIRAVSST